MTLLEHLISKAEDGECEELDKYGKDEPTVEVTEVDPEDDEEEGDAAVAEDESDDEDDESSQMLKLLAALKG